MYRFSVNRLRLVLWISYQRMDFAITDQLVSECNALLRRHDPNPKHTVAYGGWISFDEQTGPGWEYYSLTRSTSLLGYHWFAGEHGGFLACSLAVEFLKQYVPGGDLKGIWVKAVPEVTLGEFLVDTVGSVAAAVIRQIDKSFPRKKT